MKTVYKYHKDEIYKYPSGGIEPSTYFSKFSNSQAKLWEFEQMEELMCKVNAIVPSVKVDSF